ncbi:MAG: NAD(P)/FAD-dependent oxidoreductase [Ruminococcaceae bacterium]|nr:NAD(P)/FAD-dependent oxidoreductase [Oscillospiraceae bacterium]
MENNSKKALIIGAGPAGLTAAYELLKNTDIKPIVIEESDVIGGISRTAEHNGNRIDIGGHRFFSKNDEVNALWQELMPLQAKPSKDDIILGNEKPIAKEGPDPETDEIVMLLRNRVSRIYFLKKFFKYPISMSGETFKNMGFKNTMRAGFGYLWSCVHKLPEDNLENFYINRFGRPLYEMFFEDYTTKLWGVSPKNLSADWGAQRVKGLSLWKALISAVTKPFKKNSAKVETSLIEQYFYPKKGPGQLWEALAAKVTEMGGEIIMNCGAKKIETDGKNILSVTADHNGTEEKFEADYYFSSMPVKDLICGMGDVPPESVRETASALPYRDFITVGLLVNKLNIQNETKIKTVGNVVPDCWIYIQEREVKLGRLQIFNNWSPYMVKDFENTVWVGLEYFCTEGDEMWNMPDDEFIKFATAELAQIGVISEENVLDSVRIKIKKAYPAYFGSYENFDEVKNYLSGIDNLWCIGRNGQHRYNNMDHSMLTAIEAVRAIADGSNDKDVVWAVNTEKEYHEQKTSEEKTA